MPTDRTMRLSGRPYRRRMARSLRTATGDWSIREGWLIRWEELESGTRGFGEVAPLPEFGSESMAEAESFLSTVDGELPEDAWRDALSKAPPATAFGLWSAAFDASSQSGAAKARVAGLLALGPAAADEVAQLRRTGLRTFKIKVGRTAPEEERDWLMAVLRSLEPAEKLRLDPNQSWSPEDWHFWRGHLEAFKNVIEFIEEPFPSATGPGELLRAAQDSPIPLALDESLSRDGLMVWEERGWPGFWILKPSLCGLPDHWLGKLATRPEKVVLSSAFETGIGMTALARLASPFNRTDHGFGTQDWFGDTWCAPQEAGWIYSLDSRGMEDIWETLPGS